MNAWYMLAAYVGAILICLALCAASLAVMMHGIVKQKGSGEGWLFSLRRAR